MIKYIVWENQATSLQRFGVRGEALAFAKDRHRKYMDRWHEVYKVDEEAEHPNIGIAQWKPNDCPECHAPCRVTHNVAAETVYVCNHCDIEIPFRWKCYFRLYRYCDECVDIGPTDKSFPTKKAECDSIHAYNERAAKMIRARVPRRVGPI